MAVRVEKIGVATLYLGDCQEILPGLERPSAVITDPPYGQKLSLKKSKGGGWGDWRPIIGDDKPFDPSYLLSLADRCVVWGAHHFYQFLPPPRKTRASGGFLVWDKRVGKPSNQQGDAEMAWLNRRQVMRVKQLYWNGCITTSKSPFNKRGAHPTQKPIEIMAWSIEQARVPPGGVILDPYMGSGSTGVAATQLGHPFIGIEIDPGYFDTACRRIEAAARQGVLQPTAQPVKP